MRIDRLLYQIEKLDYYIQNKSTGAPNHLAKKLGVSPSTVYRLIKYAETKGAQIEYDYKIESYYYEKPGRFKILHFEEFIEENTSQG